MSESGKEDSAIRFKQDQCFGYRTKVKTNIVFHV
jgi:hypothetical protein